MEFYQLAILAIIQGATEFLPVSSSGHLAAIEILYGWTEGGLTLNVAVHFGTLIAVMLYFWRDMITLLNGTYRIATFRPNKDSKLVLNLIIATLPIVGAGLFIIDYMDVILNNLALMGYSFIGFGILLWIADRMNMTVYRVDDIGPLRALVFGLAQVLALIPGTSRSGITMTAGRFLGMDRTEAARFSMLMSIPTILAATTLILIKMENLQAITLGSDLVIATFLSFLAGILSIAAMMAIIKKLGFGIFVVYRIALGAALVYWAYSI